MPTRLRLLLVVMASTIAQGVAYEPAWLFVDPFPDGVRHATHIFAANATSVRVVSSRTGRVFRHEPAWLHYGQLFEVELAHVEPLYPSTWKPPGSIMVFIEGYTSDLFRTALVGRNQIYILSRRPDGYFTHPGSKFLEPIEKREDILQAISTKLSTTDLHYP